MHKLAPLPLILLVLGCHSATPAAPRHPAPAPATDTALQDPHADAVDRLVGVWQGQAVGTPLGDFPFAIAFDREPATADVHAHIDNGQGMSLDFRFHRIGPMWVLTEEGKIPDVGVQTHTLVPAAAGPDGPRWLDRDDPSYVDTAWAVTDDTLVMTAKVHGEVHAVFRMQRARGADAEHLRQAIAAVAAGEAR